MSAVSALTLIPPHTSTRSILRPVCVPPRASAHKRPRVPTCPLSQHVSLCSFCRLSVLVRVALKLHSSVGLSRTSPSVARLHRTRSSVVRSHRTRAPSSAALLRHTRSSAALLHRTRSSSQPHKPKRRFSPAHALRARARASSTRARVHKTDATAATEQQQQRVSVCVRVCVCVCACV